MWIEKEVEGIRLTEEFYLSYISWTASTRDGGGMFIT